MTLNIDKCHSRYLAAVVTTVLLFCCSQTAWAGVDDVWAASPPTYDSSWAQQYAIQVGPGNSG
ncbi:hypothetical protein, partial [Aeromonas sp. Y311-2]|uniref:hypothetical protein n=1 Tax=Aeromonas sp. Y311-2 TaxID=2990507 RepID=UPI0022E28565